MATREELFELFVRHIRETHQFSEQEIEQFLKPKPEQIPVSIFANRKLSGLEVLVKYLKENLGLRFHEIAKLLNRNDRTIWATYSHSKHKFTGRIKTESGISIPVSIFQNRKFSVLEHIVTELKAQKLSNKQIADFLNRDSRTIWTVYNRVNKKNE